MSAETVLATQVLREIWFERERQEQLKVAGKFLWTCADNTVMVHGAHYSVTNSMKLVVLAEEFGEASREVSDLMIAECKIPPALLHGHHDILVLQKKLRTELIQTASVCVAWVEALAKQGVRP